MTQGLLFDDVPQEAPPPSVDDVLAKARAGGHTFTLTVGNSLEVLPTLAANSVDAVVCDPPYELGFMGKKWDASGIAFSVPLWREVLRVLKPGGMLLAFSGTRTQHRMVCAIEDAGFEVRDQMAWTYGSGFPKSLDVSKAIDAAAGAVREVVGPKVYGDGHVQNNTQVRNMSGRYNFTLRDGVDPNPTLTAPATDAAREWAGWGTALKPAWEPICVARKPLDGTVADNVTRWGTGGINVDAGRVGTDGGTRWVDTGDKGDTGQHGGGIKDGGVDDLGAGRWPANIIHDGSAEVAGLLGDAARFFYCAKASRGEREAGCEALPAMAGHDAVDRDEGSAGVDNPRAGAGRTASTVRNFHPTVKPVDLMRYLVSLVAKPGALVLDPFAGSGTTGIGCVLAGVRFHGIEMDTAHACIAWHRLTWWAANRRNP